MKGAEPMRIVVLLRYPKVEVSDWKRELVERLMAEDFQVGLVFGESSYWRHLKAGLKEFGLGVFKRQGRQAVGQGGKGVNIYRHFNHKIPVRRVRDLNSRRAAAVIKGMNPDYLLLLGTGIVRRNILEIPVYKTVHCHHGYLPDYRGVHTAEWSFLLSGEVYLTSHFVDAGIDTGDILLRKKIDVDGIDTVEALRRACRLASVDLVVETFKGLRQGSIEPVKQERGAGRQYFAMHPVFKEQVARQLKGAVNG
jgi:folate-dependent phosphoribosylglycinamide formyltransferase PurN